jgi:hypothetical protein
MNYATSPLPPASLNRYRLMKLQKEHEKDK